MALPKETLLSSLTSNQEEHISLLQQFIQTPSPNPPGDTTTAAKTLTTYLSSKGIPYKILTAPGHPEKTNIVSEFTGGAGPGPRVVLNGHIDHFPVDESTIAKWDRDPYSGEISNSRIYGRGAVDMKSGTCSLLIAYAALYSQRESLKGSVVFSGVSDEETGGAFGTRYLIHQNRDKWGGDLMLSAEPSGQTIRFSEKGTLRVRGVVRTRGAHGAYLNLSKGAIRTAAHFLSNITSAIEAIPPCPPPEIAAYLADQTVLDAVDAAMGPRTSSIIALPTVNIGTIAGGIKVNMIPDSCTFELDIRLPVGLVAETVLEVIAAEINSGRYPDASIEISTQQAASNPASVSPLTHPVISALKKNAALLNGGTKPVVIPSMGATDCKHYRYAGVPAYVYGCSPLTSESSDGLQEGTNDVVASVNESASVDEFLHVAKVHALATWDFLTE